VEFLAVAGKALFVYFFAFVDDAVLFIHLLEELSINVFGHFEDFLNLSKLDYVASFSFVALLDILLEIV
jgi:hypothetical protein